MFIYIFIWYFYMNFIQSFFFKELKIDTNVKTVNTEIE